MTQSENYRDCAAECLRLAVRATKAEAKALLINMSVRWLELAATIERQRPWDKGDIATFKSVGHRES
jgi:hypothetical protein